MSCDDMYVCERGICMTSCTLKIMMGKCDKFDTTDAHFEFIKKFHHKETDG